jgi:hypothetical protein
MRVARIAVPGKLRTVRFEPGVRLRQSGECAAPFFGPDLELDDAVRRLKVGPSYAGINRGRSEHRTPRHRLHGSDHQRFSILGRILCLRSSGRRRWARGPTVVARRHGRHSVRLRQRQDRAAAPVFDEDRSGRRTPNPAAELAVTMPRRPWLAIGPAAGCGMRSGTPVSHTLRKTVRRCLNDADVSTRRISDQLGRGAKQCPKTVPGS